MQLSQQQIDKFKQIYKSHYQRDIDDALAREKGLKLIRLLMVIDKPVTQRDYQFARELLFYLNMDCTDNSSEE